MKRGDKLICIKHDPLDVNTGEMCPAPKVGEMVTVCSTHDCPWLLLEEYELEDREGEIYHHASCFRKVENHRATVCEVAFGEVENPRRILEPQIA